MTKKEIVEKMKILLKKEEELRKELQYNREMNIGTWDVKQNLRNVLNMKNELIKIVRG